MTEIDHTRRDAGGEGGSRPPRPLLLAALLGMGLLGPIAAGCSPDPIDETFEGELTDDDERWEADDSAYDDYEIEMGEGWTITVDMRSRAFDAYAWLIGPDGLSKVQNDDSGEGRNARFAYTTRQSGTFIVRANSRRGGQRGPYTLHVTAHPAQAE